MKTLFQTSLPDDQVQCRMCRHYCRIRPGETGKCRVRENRSGTLVSLVYPLIVARGVDPIEKKPIYHLKPGSTAFSIASAGCNFTCTFCQNAAISQYPPPARGIEVTAENVVNQALAAGCSSIAYTYTEPTVYFELALETARLAGEKGLYNIFVSNGFMSPEVIDAAAPVLDAANIDLKSFSSRFYRQYCGGELDPVKDSLIRLNDRGILLEVTTLIIPGLNDDPDDLRAMAGFIAEKLGRHTPWHISRFHPCHEMTDRPPTDPSTLETARTIGHDAGLVHIYLGNVSLPGSGDTCCPDCGTVVIRRRGYDTTSHMDVPGRCPDCGAGIHGIF